MVTAHSLGLGRDLALEKLPVHSGGYMGWGHSTSWVVWASLSHAGTVLCDARMERRLRRVQGWHQELHGMLSKSAEGPGCLAGHLLCLTTVVRGNAHGALHCTPPLPGPR